MGKNDFDINLENCRNIKSVDGGSILIKKNVLNVFYGRNGTGKTTLAHALNYICLGTDEAKAPLASHRYIATGDSADSPHATCATRVNKLLIFNDEWVSAHCFEKSNVHRNAFELYIRDADIKKLEKQRDSKLGRLSTVLQSSDVSELKESLTIIQKGLGRLKGNGNFVASAPAVRAFQDGVPIERIPNCLSPVVKGMTAKEKAEWLDWHVKHPSVKSHNTCPYCGSEDMERLEACEDYDSSRNTSAVKQWASIASTYDKVGSKLSRSTSALLGRVLRSKKSPSSLDLTALADLTAKVVETIDAIEGLASALEDKQCSDASVLVSTLMTHKTTLDTCDVFLKTSGGKKTTEAKAISQLVSAVERVAAIQSELDQLSKELIFKITSNVNGHEHEINTFLEQCGYPYTVSIEFNPQISDAQIFLTPSHSTSSWHLENPEDSLSFGERNALSLVLFMFEAIHEPGALIVLDDPISSFDYDKRYGILYALFASDGIFAENLQGKTVLVMTHDFLVVTDLISIPGKDVSATKVKGQFLSCNSKGVLQATPLGKDAIAPYTQLLRKEIEAAKSRPEIIRLICIRNLCEMLRSSPSDKSTRYGWTFRLLSEIIHGCTREAIVSRYDFETLDCRAIRMCENCVKNLSGVDFDFWKAVDRYADCTKLLIDIYETVNLSSLEKLSIVRLLILRNPALTSNSNIMKRFADESCHIGGSYLYQMDGRTYDQVPFYVTAWCDDVVKLAKKQI